MITRDTMLAVLAGLTPDEAPGVVRLVRTMADAGWMPEGEAADWLALIRADVSEVPETQH